MAATSFDLKFQYVLRGCEGSATDSRVLSSALSRTDAFHVPSGKYYLVDVGYPNIPGFLAPYRNVRYHLKEFSQNNPINTTEELFNLLHSLVCNSVERIFGILKGRFAILRTVTTFPIKTQLKIVLACCILHNFIMSIEGVVVDHENDGDDNIDGDDHSDSDNKSSNSSSDEDPLRVPRHPTFGRGQRERDDCENFRFEIAKKMWEDYSASLS